MDTIFCIGPAAIGEIRSLIAQSGRVDPVVTLGQASDALRPSIEFGKKLLEGATPQELQEAARREVGPAFSDAELELTVFVYEASECVASDILRFEGVRVAMSPAWRATLSGYQLDFDGKRFFLRRLDNASKASLS